MFNRIFFVTFTALAFILSGCNASKQSGPVTEPALVSGIDKTAIDKDTRPQDDFFRYVNGTWLDETEIPASKSRYGVFNFLFDETQIQLQTIIQQASTNQTNPNQRKLGEFYQSYMDVEAANLKQLTPLQPYLAQIEAIENYSELASTFAKLHKIGVSGVFDFFVYPDAKQPDTMIAYLYQSGLSMPDRDYYLKSDDKFVEARTALQKYIKAVLKAINHPNSNEASIQLMALEGAIAEQHISRVDSRDAEKNYLKQTQQQVNALFGSFDWNAYAQNANMDKSETLVIRNSPYFDGLSQLISAHSLDIWKNYLRFKLVDTYAPLLHQELVDLHFAFHSTALNGIPEQKPRWKRAVSATSDAMGELLGQEYVAKHFPAEAKRKMQTLVGNLTKAYEQSIQQLSWMTPETKQAALGKLSAFTAKIGYPDQWRDYQGLSVNKGDLVGNYINYYHFEYDYQVSKIGQPVDKNTWHMTPQTINAYYNPVGNEIVFPAGILQYPFFNLAADEAVNYGAIGAVIGHEIGHGFDDQGSKYDGSGSLRNWWTEHDRQAFDELGSKLAKQYSQFEPIEGLPINGELTLGENIGDLAGVTIAYNAYQMSLQGKPAIVIDGLTGPQRFFMGYAQVWRGKYREDALRAKLVSGPHSPGEFRVNGVLPNITGFYQAFDVKPGDKMYLAPEQRIKIW